MRIVQYQNESNGSSQVDISTAWLVRETPKGSKRNKLSCTSWTWFLEIESLQGGSYQQ